MSVICIGGICIPYSVFWPIVVLMIKPLWDFLLKLFGYDIVDKKPKKDDAEIPSVDKWIPGVLYDLVEPKELDTLFQKNRVVVLRFTAPWCKPCKAIEPLFVELASSNKNFVFVTIDVDKLDEIAAQYTAIQIPLFVACVAGKEVSRMSGRDEGQLRKFIEKLS